MTADRDRIAAEIRRMGPVFNEDVLKATYDLFAPLQARAPKGGVEVHSDIAYGDDARHRLDLFVPAPPPAAPAPVVVYVHGGGFIAGSRSPVAGLIYDNVARFFARNGMIGANMTYRLAPQHKWPSGAADVGRAVRWLRDNVAAHGGDPGRIFAMGQSAGATHVATFALVPAVHGADGPGIAGAILLSGVYAPLHPGFTDGTPASHHLAYYGEDVASWTEKSPLSHVRPGHPPLYIAVAEYDPYPLAWPSAALLAEAVRCDRRLPWFKLLRGHNHVSPAMQIGSEVDTLGPELLDFVAATGG